MHRACVSTTLIWPNQAFLCARQLPHHQPPHYKQKKTKQSFMTTLQEASEGRKEKYDKQTNEHDDIRYS